MKRKEADSDPSFLRISALNAVPSNRPRANVLPSTEFLGQPSVSRETARTSVASLKTARLLRSPGRCRGHPAEETQGGMGKPVPGTLTCQAFFLTRSSGGFRVVTGGDGLRG